MASSIHTVHLVLNLADHGLVVLSFGLLNRFNWVSCELLDLLLTSLVLFLLGKLEPFFSLLGVLEVVQAAHRRAWLSHVLEGRIRIRHVLTETHATRANLPVIGGLRSLGRIANHVIVLLH